MPRIVLCVILLWFSTATLYAQQTPSGVTFERSVLRSGPGSSYSPLEGEIPGGTILTLHERSALGAWVRVETPDGAEGWIMTGDLTLEDVSITNLPVTALPDADPDALTNLTPEERLLYSTPILPVIDAAVARAIRTSYAWGQTVGNGAAVITRVGDSNMTNPYILPRVEYGYELGPYDALESAVTFFGDSFGRESIATQRGLNTAALFDPFWAPPNTCEADETPLDCEYRESMPTVAVIMFGQNDMRVMSREEYREQLQRIVQETLNAGVIPLLSTFASTPDDEDYYSQSLHFNAIAIQLAAENNVPLMNYWLATRDLPTFGVGEDNVHFTSTGSGVNFTRGQESDYGLSLYNLVLLSALDRVRLVIVGEE